MRRSNIATASIAITALLFGIAIGSFGLWRAQVLKLPALPTFEYPVADVSASDDAAATMAAAALTTSTMFRKDLSPGVVKKLSVLQAKILREETVTDAEVQEVCDDLSQHHPDIAAACRKNVMLARYF